MNAFTEAPLLGRTGFHTATRLRFVSSEDRYSVYHTPEGDEVYLAHGTAQVLVPFDDLDLQHLWSRFQEDHSMYDREDFLEALREMTTEPDTVDEEVGFCADCYGVRYDDDLCSTGHETQVCDSCRDNYWYCDDCEDLYRSTTTTLNETEVCTGCRDRGWTYCGECDGWRRDDDAYLHEHREGCDCTSPAQAFAIRNDGEGWLDNDCLTTITLPAGVISDVGLGEIATFLRCVAYEAGGDEGQHLRTIAHRLSEVGVQWQTKRGNFTKRLSRMAYSEYGLKLSPAVVSQVGCIARDHSTAVDFEIAVTRDLNLPAEEFAHEESCWWQSYFSSRCALKSNGGFGLRTFTEQSWGHQVTGRAWVMPLRKTETGLTPTFETRHPDGFVVFNGYGALEGYAPARILSHMAGMTYRKITFTCDPMYVNSSSGYLVAPEEIAEPYTDGSLRLSVNQHADLYTTEKEMAHA